MTAEQQRIAELEAEPACWWPRVRALCVYLLIYQHVPAARTAELLAAMGAAMSVGFVAAQARRDAATFSGWMIELRRRLCGDAMLHADETSGRMNGALWWLHRAEQNLAKFEHIDDMLAKLEDRWDSHGHYVDRLTGGVVWYMPAVALSIQALVGPALMHPGLGDVSSLNANHEGGRVVLRWGWPEGCTEAKTAWRTGADPLSLQDPAATTAKVTNTTYGIKGGWIPCTPAHAQTRGTVNEPHALCYSVRRVGRRRRELQVDITGADNPTEQRTKSEES